MNIKDFFKRLGKNGYTYIEAIGKDSVQIKLTIEIKDLTDNIELLARELHMEVENNTRIAYERIKAKTKHNKIFIDEPWEVMKKQLKELEDGI